MDYAQSKAYRNRLSKYTSDPNILNYAQMQQQMSLNQTLVHLYFQMRITLIMLVKHIQLIKTSFILVMINYHNILKEL